MNLPPDKVKLLCQYDNEKKWELVCDQVSLEQTHKTFTFSFTVKLLLFTTRPHNTPLNGTRNENQNYPCFLKTKKRSLQFTQSIYLKEIMLLKYDHRNK